MALKKRKILWIIVLAFAALFVLSAVVSAIIPVGRHIAVVRLEGIIDESTWHTGILRDMLNDGNVAGVLLRIDSPGGAVAPSQELYGAVAAYRAAGKPLVVSMGNMAASGGYYAAAPAHRIFALPGTLTGSIGVIFTLPVYQDLAKKVGIGFRVLKAGDLKDAGSPFREMTDEEAKSFQALLDDTHEQFIADAAAGRNMDTEDMRLLANGMIFTGRQALERGLIDTLGGYEDALAYLRAACGIPDIVKPVEKKPRQTLKEMILESAQKNIPALGSLSRPAGLYYLFVP